jgi:hypothetical protein
MIRKGRPASMPDRPQKPADVFPARGGVRLPNSRVYTANRKPAGKPSNKMPENQHDHDGLVEKIEELRGEVHAIRRICVWAVGICGLALLGSVGWAFRMQQAVTTITVNQQHVQRDGEKLESAVDDLADAVAELAARVGRQQ